MIDRDFIRRMRAKYGSTESSSCDRLATLRAGEDGPAAELLDRVLSDASIPFAVFRSRALGRDFVLARDQAALEALGEEHRRLPVVFFEDCEKLGRQELGALRVLLDLRTEFGPTVSVAVEGRLG